MIPDFLTNSHPSMSLFSNNIRARQEIEELYYDKLDVLAISYESLKIETSFGDTHLILTGKEGKPPLVLLHGSNGCAPVAIEAIYGLLDDFRVYAIDVVGQPNLSEGIRPDKWDDSYGQWMFEILTRLNVRDVVLVGTSFGGFIGWKTLIFDDKRIAKAFLIAPAGIVNGSAWQQARKVFLPVKLYQCRKNIRFIHQFLEGLFTERDEFAIAFLSMVLLHFEMDFASIPRIKNEEARKIETPLHLIAAQKDLLFPGVKMLKRARKIFPSLREVLLLPNSKHVPGRRDNEIIVDFIKKHS